MSDYLRWGILGAAKFAREHMGPAIHAAQRGALTALATSARAEAEMRMRVHVSRARIRTAVRVVIGTLGLFAGGLIVFNRPYLAPYGTAVGQLVLLLVGGIVAFGWWLLQRMAHIQPPERFLDTSQRRIA